jgi:hypothetical protein
MQALAASCEELRARTGNPPLAEKIKAKVYVNEHDFLFTYKTTDTAVISFVFSS